MQTKVVVDVSEGARERFSCFPGRDCKGVGKKLLSLVKLYQWI